MDSAKISEEFSAVYVFDLRGNCRTSGELRQREAGNIFGLGSRTPIAITILVKKPEHNDKAVIRYCDIGDYLSRDEKLAKISQLGSISAPEMEWQDIIPNDKYDWINQRDDLFEKFVPIAPEVKFTTASKSYFVTYSLGINTNRDGWVYNSSRESLIANIGKMVDFYNSEVSRFQKHWQKIQA